jgi:hypothetical protein
MRMNYRVLSLLVMLALAVPVVAAPATSFAQSAGDDQYVDPFQDDNGGGGGGNQGNQGNQGNSTPSDQQSVAQAPADSSGTAGATATESAQNDSLPRTGLPMGPIVAVGVILLGGGFALRRAWPRPH